MKKMLNIVLFGPPGAGKGTQSENLINKYGLVHLSTGDILRSEIERGTTLGKQAKEIMDKGELVGDEIVIGMIESKLDDNSDAKGFIFDGFPRTTAQAIALDDLLQKKGTGISGMLALEVEDEELVKRLLIRGQSSGRPDDKNEDVIRRRIQEYNNKTLPLKNFYNEQGKFHSINGIGSIDQIFKLLVDRIIFLNAEMDLTALETELEHLDLTIKDFDVADQIAPELLLEIDAIKRIEAEEAEEEKLNLKKISKVKKVERSVKKVPVKKSITKSKPKKITRSEKKKSKPVIKKTAQKTNTPIKKNVSKKVVAKKPSKKITVKTKAKKTVKKTIKPKKLVVKKKISSKKLSPKKQIKSLKKPIKKSIKKVAVKSKSKKTAKRK